MKITNIRSEDLVERTYNNDLTDDDKYILTETVKPKKYKHNPSPETVRNKANGEETNTTPMKNID